ncbi:MAG: saccharopine dehydrogenase family protein [Bacteroidota bacterium]|jgi:saccharopine dehydrogenase-like NADP-dependent oxidoreductase
MKTILILGAGLSASSLIRYLLEHATTNGWLLRVTDQDIELVKRKIHGHPNATALNFNALDPAERRPEIERADLVISMLPARFHPEVAKDCVDYKKNLITPSYISPEMRSLDEKARQAHITIMNEIGVDPGIDHMSAMKIIHQIKDSGGKMTAFRSFCGGLMAPESDNNPWNYKFTWNPRNVVLAGQGGASCFLDHGEYKYIPYNRLFSRLMRISIDGYGDFEGYANRDSLSYRKTYGLENIPTIYRGTLRRPGYCQAWNVFIELGMTDDSYKMDGSEKLTPRSFLNAFLPYHPNMSVEDKFRQFLGKEREALFERFEWLGLFSKEVTIGVVNASPAQLLEKILTGKLVLNAGDKDMLVMYHEFEYEKDGQRYLVTSSMVNVGEDQIYTSMSNTVGLPVAIAAKMILNGQIRKHGVTLPIEKEIYTPILKELEDYGILFSETKTEF